MSGLRSLTLPLNADEEYCIELERCVVTLECFLIITEYAPVAILPLPRYVSVRSRFPPTRLKKIQLSPPPSQVLPEGAKIFLLPSNHPTPTHIFFLPNFLLIRRKSSQLY